MRLKLYELEVYPAPLFQSGIQVDYYQYPSSLLGGQSPSQGQALISLLSNPQGEVHVLTTLPIPPKRKSKKHEVRT